jgi:phosphoserine phosphatase
VKTMRARGTRTVLVSGGFTRFAEPVAEQIGFDRAVANVLEIDRGVLTGRVLPPVIDSAAKLVTLEAECAALGLTSTEALAIGDGANDVPMLREAGLGVAYHGHSAAIAAADAAVRFGDLTTLLYALGIPRAQWVTG